LTDVTVKKTVKLNGVVCAPASKSYTQRMLIAAALSDGVSQISNPLDSEDTEATLRAVTALGAKVAVSEGCWTVEGAKQLKGAKDPVDCGESGATLRFMIPVAALAQGSSTLTFVGSLEKRPVDPLLKSLKELGAKTSLKKIGEKDAVFVEGGGIQGGKTVIAGDVSSQFISGLMFACPMAEKNTQITVSSPLESKDYVKMTAEVLSQHQVAVEINETFSQINIPAKQTFKPYSGRVTGDFSSAAFLLAAAAITKSTVQVQNLEYKSFQGDRVILGILKRMGVEGTVCPSTVEIYGCGGLIEAADLDAKNCPDLVPAFAVLACFADGVSHVFNAGRLKFKESNRLQTVYEELKKMGAQIDLEETGLTIHGPCNLHGAAVDSHNDHRIAMACAVAALRAEGETTIQNAQCVRKSYPQFFTHLSQLGAEVYGGKQFR
jgi:3-phosphoshikimate 1-carboxyvinyltransferase